MRLTDNGGLTDASALAFVVSLAADIGRITFALGAAGTDEEDAKKVVDGIQHTSTLNT